MNLETRSFEIREFNEDERTVTGIAVPYDTPTSVGNYTEQFARGAIESIDGVKLFWNHSEVIGKVIAGRETAEGYEVTARISDTTLGRDTYTYLRDEVIDKFSVGFIPVEQRTEDDGTVTRTRVDLREVSLVPFPAYATATVSEVRAESNNATTNQTKEELSEDSSKQNMSEVTKYDDSEIRSKIEVVERELAVVRENGVNNSAPATAFRSAGEFVKALADNDSKAQSEIRAFTGATLADSHTSNDWKNDLLVIVDKGRPLVNIFDRGPLAAQGNSVEYPKVASTSGDVAVQANEGDDLAYLEVGITTATAPVKTYGGYSSLSRQAIERSDVSYLDAVLKYQAASYAKVTNAAVGTALAAATPQTGTSFGLGASTGAQFIGAVVDGVQKIEDNGLGAQADFVLVSTDVYARLAGLVDSANRPLFDINGDGANTLGNINVRGIAGSLAGLAVVPVATLPARTLYVASSSAITVWENAGAPIRLADENIINLTKDFALYGYLAVGVKNPNGLVKATIAA